MDNSVLEVYMFYVLLFRMRTCVPGGLGWGSRGVSGGGPSGLRGEFRAQSLRAVGRRAPLIDF